MKKTQGKSTQRNRMKQIQKNSREDYLEALLLLQSQQSSVHSSELASFMDFSRASVSQAVLSMEKDGFLSMDDKYSLHLTEKGRKIAEQVHRKHEYFEKKLLIAGVDPATADKEGGSLGHAISDDSFEKIAEHGMKNEHATIEQSCGKEQA
ncbi:MAG: metal-dependent transcriptional regulator [Clostridiales bacterium]|nr:metal-dependent transcriptional regulator [Clostridiales bacterium]